MKKDVSPGVIAAAVVILAVVIGFAAWKTFSAKSSGPTDASSLTAKQKDVRNAMIKSMQNPTDMKSMNRDTAPVTAGK